jgi:bifunctional non-homologous end joining protein LigD
MKCERDDEFVVVGYTRGEGARGRLGALDIATWEGNRLVCRGKVGSGLDENAIDVLLGRLAGLAAPGPTAEGQYQAAPKGRTHVRPEIVVSVQYFGWSEGGSVWHPSFRGIRDEVAPKQCTAGPKSASLTSSAAPVELKTPKSNAPPATAPELQKMASAKLDMNTPPKPSKAGRPAEEDKTKSSEGAPRVAISNAKKVLWPEDGITKGELCAYYREIAPAMLPYLRDRPVMMVRYPNGIDGKSFYQWNAPAGAPSWIRTCRVQNETGAEFDGLLIDDPDGLTYLANLAAIPIHILASRCGALDQCDFLTIDFDLKSAPFASAVTLALALRETLEAIDLVGYPKTSGQTGLHVFVPLGQGTSYATARALADLLGHLLVATHPDKATMERTIAKRGDRVYVDTGQTGPFRTIAAPFSVRAQKRAPVSTPLRWEEVSIALNPSDLNVRSVLDRVKSLGDPMLPLLSAKPDVAAAVAKLEERTRKGPARTAPAISPRPRRKR